MNNLAIPPTIARIAPNGNLTPRQVRGLMLEMVKRRIRPGAGSSIEFLQRRTAMLAVPGYLFYSPEGIEVDIIFGRYPWLREALQNPRFDPAGDPVIALPYLILMKLTAQRAQDWADVSRMLGWAAPDDLDAVRAVVNRYSPEDIEDLETLIFLGKKEQETPP